MKYKVITLLILLGACHGASGQQFWLTAPEFPGGPKTCITIAGDSCIFTGLTQGVIRSMDNGQTFDHSLASPAIFSLFTSSSGRVFAGGTGIIYYTDDLGSTWDSVSQNSEFPVLQFVENKQNGLFAITGMLSVELGYIGAGVYYSGDGGLTWSERNQGLGIYRCCEKIAIDKNDRLYLGMADEYVTGNAGLFISDNDAQLWEHIDIFIDGKGAVPDQVKIANTIGLSVSPHDSVYFSFAGTAVNVSVTLNTCKSINDIETNSYWKTYPIFNSVSWWLDRTMNSIYFSGNGNWYGSTKGSIQTGATYFSQNQGLQWMMTSDGLGVDMTGNRNFQSFAENAQGRVFMVQLLDERIYFTDQPGPSDLPHPDKPADLFVISPNPVSRGSYFSIRKKQDSGLINIYILNHHGQKVLTSSLTANSTVFQAPDSPGIYYILPDSPAASQSARLLVY